MSSVSAAPRASRIRLGTGRHRMRALLPLETFALVVLILHLLSSSFESPTGRIITSAFNTWSFVRAPNRSMREHFNVIAIHRMCREFIHRLTEQQLDEANRTHIFVWLCRTIAGRSLESPRFYQSTYSSSGRCDWVCRSWTFFSFLSATKQTWLIAGHYLRFVCRLPRQINDPPSPQHVRTPVCHLLISVWPSSSAVF